MAYPRTMNLEDLLKREEGFVPHAYKDSEGYWTIGYGKLIDERKGGGISKEQALAILRSDILEKREELFEALPWVKDLGQVRCDILIAMAFQMGVAGVLKFKNTLAAIKAGNYVAAAKGMRSSKWAEQSPGRAERMAKAMETGVFV